MVDVNVVGSGPNGLAAAVVLARAGLSVNLIERASEVGGALRTAEITLPGFRHDLGCAVYPSALASPFFRAFDLTRRVPFVAPEISYAHPFDSGGAAVAYRDVDRTADALGTDGHAWNELFQPLLNHLNGVVSFAANSALRWPDDAAAALVFAGRILEQGTWLGRPRFRGAAAPALLAGVAGHTPPRQPSLTAAGASLLLAAYAHARGWGFPIGGAQAIAAALLADFRAHGGRVQLDTEVRHPADLETSRVTVLDTSPAFLASFAGAALPPSYRQVLRRHHRVSGLVTVHFALSGAVPWSSPEVRHAPSVHLGGTRHEILHAVEQVQRGWLPAQPLVLATQPSILDPTRAPAGRQVLRADTHVPPGSDTDMTEAIIAQIERFAPGFRDGILHSETISARSLSPLNTSYAGDDRLGSGPTLRQLITRPVPGPRPWQTPVRGLYLCSAFSSPGLDVHGMNGFHAAALALRTDFGIREIPSLGTTATR